MLRSLASLLLLANLSTTGEPGQFQTIEAPTFNQTELLEVHPVPTLKAGKVAPLIEAKAALLMDSGTGIILYEKNARDPLPMASLTKIMTAILILENHDLDEVVQIQSNFRGLEGVRIGLHQYEAMNINNLLHALLIRSAGDAAIALGEYHSGSVEAFVDEMNQRALELQLYNTHFANPVGLDDEGQHASAYDLAQLSRYAMRFENFRNIVRKSEATVSSSDGEFVYNFDSTNKLLNSYLDILGVKTGTTDAAGESLINMARGPQGQEVIAVVLNSPDRFQENKSMLDWALRSYEW